MDRVPTSPKGKAAYAAPKSEYWNVPLMRNDRNRRAAGQSEPVHAPLRRRGGRVHSRAQRSAVLSLSGSQHAARAAVSRPNEFAGKSRRGLYGDVVEELDKSVGTVLDAIRDEKLAEKTFVIFTSDNGPWLHATASKAARPACCATAKVDLGRRHARADDRLAAGHGPRGRTSAELASTLDLLPTFCSMAGVEPPKDRPLDGYDITPTLTGGKSPRREMFYYRSYDLMAVRLGPWKAHFLTQTGYGQPQPDKHDPPLLFNLEVDPGESYNVADKHPEVLDQINTLVEKHRAGMKPAPSQID